MRETISIDKDFLNGTESHSIKMKPLDSEVRGIVTLTMFDENGERVREVRTENVIMDWMKTQSLLHYCYGLTFNNTDYHVNESPYCIKPKTSTMYLSSYDQPESSKKPYFKWDYVGYANRTEVYSGTDTKKGSYNAVESKFYVNDEGDEVYHLVYDFPTHASNGNINSIIWGKDYEPILKTPPKFKYAYGGDYPEVYTGLSEMNTKRLIMSNNGTFNEYVVTGSSSKYELRKREINMCEYTCKETVLCTMSDGTWTDYSTSKHFYDFTDSFYQLDTGNTSFTYRKYTKEGSMSEKKVVSLKTPFPSVTGSNKSTYGGAFICNSAGPTHYFCAGYVKGAREGTYDLKAYIYNLSGDLVIAHTLESDTKFALNSSTYEVKVRGRGTKGSINIGSYFFDETKVYADEDWNFVTVGSTLCDYFEFDCPIYSLTTWNNYNYYMWRVVYPKKCVVAHTKLPSTVTKTNTNTMKVQYDFIYKKPSLGQFIEG